MKNLSIILMILASSKVLAQNEEREPIIPTIWGAIMMADSHVPKATAVGKSVHVISTWAFHIDYFFHPRWSVASLGDITIQSFQVADNKMYKTWLGSVQICSLVFQNTFGVVGQ